MSWFWFGVALAAPALSPPHGPPPHGPPPHGPPPPERILDRAEEVGLPAETLTALSTTLEAARPALDAARDATREAHEALRALMTGSRLPDRARVLAVSQELALAEADLRELHLGLELDLRAALTPEQWRLVAPPQPPERPGAR